MSKYFLFFSFVCLGFLQGKPYNLSICSIIDNEAPFLKEWIEYHRLIGVDHFYLYNIESKDQYKQVLKSYIQKNIVTLVQWPNLYRGKEDDFFLVMIATRIPAYENAAKYRAINETKWLVNLQVNEFLVPSKDKTLAEILSENDLYASVILESHCFDASVKDAFSMKKLIIEHNTFTLPIIEPTEKMIQKTIFKPEQVHGFLWPPYRLVLKDQQKEIVLKDEILQINQYMNRVKNDFSIEQVKRPLNVDPKSLNPEEKKAFIKEFQIQDTDQPISRFVPELRKKMGLPPTLAGGQ